MNITITLTDSQSQELLKFICCHQSNLLLKKLRISDKCVNPANPDPNNPSDIIKDYLTLLVTGITDDLMPLRNKINNGVKYV